MALSDTFQPFLFYFEIPQGAHFRLQFPAFMDATTGEPFDFVNDPAGDWSGRLEVRDMSDALVATFATSGAAGTMTLGTDGSVAIDMDADQTALLPATTDALGANSKTLVAQLILTDPIDNEPWCWANGRGRIRKQVTG